MTAPRILAATDGSENAARAVEVAARLSKHLEAELLIATVGAGRLSPGEIAEARRDGMSEGEALELLSREVLSDARKRAQGEGASRIRVLDCVGDPSRILLELARSEHADMIVIGRRGRGRLAGLLFGSVSQKLVSLAPCTVAVVP